MRSIIYFMLAFALCCMIDLVVKSPVGFTTNAIVAIFAMGYMNILDGIADNKRRIDKLE